VTVDGCVTVPVFEKNPPDVCWEKGSSALFAVAFTRHGRGLFPC
jgi:hypothetical protein